MEYTEAQLQEALLRFVKNELMGCGCVLGTIASVDTSKFTCVVTVGDNTHSNVPLRVLIGSQASVIEIPVVNSNCEIIFRDAKFNQPQLLFVDQVDQLLINCKTLVQYNGGLLGGMVKAKVLQTQSNFDKAILDALLAIINGAPIPEPGGGAPSALQAALQAALAGKQSGVWDGLEDGTVTH
jgi:hypothetical protein